MIEHDRLVAVIATRMYERGTLVWAAIPGYTTPREIGGHIPDVLVQEFPAVAGIRRAVETVYEVETHDSISSAHAGEQWLAFARWAGASEARTFVIAVPEGSALEARARAAMLGIMNARFEEIR